MPIFAFNVRDSRTNEPIPGAQIVVYRDQAMLTSVAGGQTDLDGLLTVDTETAPGLAYSIIKEGYVRIRSIDLNPTNDVRMDSTEAKFKVTFSAGPNGDVSPKGPMAVAADSRVTATAAPDPGYVFRIWIVDGKDYTGVNPFSFIINRDGLNIVAEFETEAEAKAKVPARPGEVVTKIEVTTVESGGIPWPFSWISGVLNWFGQAWENVSKALIQAQERQTQASIESTRSLTEQMIAANEARMKDYAKPAGLGGWLWGGLSESMGELVRNSMNEALTEVVRLTPEATGHSPEAKKQMAAVLEPYANSIVDAVLAEVSPAKYAKSPLTPEEAKNSLNLIMGGIVSVEITLFVAHAFLEGATLGQVEALSQIENMVISKLGLNQIASSAVTIPLNELVLKRAQQYYTAQYTPEIPRYQDLIEMVVKEKLTLEQFKESMRFLGYSDYWSQKIWDKHFIPPSLSDILTAYRRQIPIDVPYVDPASPTGYGVRHVDRLSVEDVHGLMKLVDLDPVFQSIFDTRFYADVPLTYARWMWETGAVKDREEVREIVRRQGVDPKYEEAVIGMITGFPVRAYRRRYWMALQSALQAGVITPDYLRVEVADNPKDADVAYWIIKIAAIRDKIAEKPAEERAKLISVGDLKKAYTKNMIDAAKMRVDLGVRGYQTTDIDLLIKLLDEEKVVTSAGGEKVALSVPEWINAWRYGKATEERVRIELQTRGLSLEEVEILLSTKKAQWGVEGEEVG